MIEKRRFSVLFIWLALLCFVGMSFPVMAQDEGHLIYEPVTKVDLGVSSLKLAVGESYTFHVVFEPENAILDTLDWYVTDERVISVDPLTNTVTALSDGEARIFAESLDQVSFDVCDVSVGNSSAKDASVMKSGTDHLGLSQKDLRKITAPTLVRYLDFVADSSLDDEDFESLSSRAYDVLGLVRSGTEESESLRAVELGLASEPLRNLQCVTLRGTLKQLLAFIKDNSDLIEVTELENVWLDVPVSDPTEGELSSKTVHGSFNLSKNADILSNITTAHNIGLTGEGRIIAVIDTGFASDHEQFKDRSGKKSRFIKEACFSATMKIGSNNFYSACTDGRIDDGSGASLDLTKITRKDKFNHGTHVAGIAAGRDGVAPDAQIIGIQAASEMRWTCSPKQKELFQCSRGSNQCCSARFVNSNLARAYDYLIELKKSGLQIDAANMSFGSRKLNGTGYTNICDSNSPFYKQYLDKLGEAGILPVVCAMNDSFNFSVASPACISSAYTVAALANYEDPYLAVYSNFNQPNVDIAAPGTNIYSSVPVNLDRKTLETTCTENCYAYMDGTSMATPMVSGSIALVRQLYPGMSAQDAGKFLKEITEKSVSKRLSRDNSKITNKFDFSKPVLDLDNLLTRFSVPDTGVTAQGQRVRVRFKDISFRESIKVKIYDTAAKKWIKGAKFRYSVDNQNFMVIDINGKGQLKTGKLYRLEIYRTIENGPTAKVVKYFRPFTSSQSLTVTSWDNAANLNIYMPEKDKQNHVIYRIYDAETDVMVKSLEADYDDPIQTVSGLKNGKKYYATAQFYRDVRVGKNNIRMYGMESDQVRFMPMRIPFNCKYGARSASTRIFCSEDPNADGIVVVYRSAADDNLKPPSGVISEKGKFFVEIEDQAFSNGKYQFIVMNYKLDENNWPWPGSSTIVDLPNDISVSNGTCSLINPKNKDNVTVTSNRKGIITMLMDFTKSDVYSKFCDSSEYSCSAKLSDRQKKFFLVMNYGMNAAGEKRYSRGILVSNAWGMN